MVVGSRGTKVITNVYKNWILSEPIESYNEILDVLDKKIIKQYWLK
jgi:hypothetical protein